MRQSSHSRRIVMVIEWYHGGMESPVRRIEKLRQYRAGPARDLSIARTISATADQAERTHRKLGELIGLWEQFVPADLAAHTSLTRLHRGVLHVTVDSSSASFELDRMLRNGLTEQLRRQFRGSLTRVKLRIGGM